MLVFGFCALLITCKKVKLTEDQLNWCPYEKGDELIFANSENEFEDSLLLRITDISIMYPARDVPARVVGEILRVKTVKNESYLDNYLLSLYAIGKHFISTDELTDESYSEGRILFDFTEESFIFYDVVGGGHSIEALNLIKPTTKMIHKIKYSDVIKLVAEAPERYRERDHFVHTLYWSKQYGYVKLVRKDGATLELKHFYRNGRDILEDLPKTE